MRHCTVCQREVNESEAPILAMGGFGNPKYLCPECASDMDNVISAKEPTEIEAAMAAISKKLSDSNQDDPLTLQTVKEIFAAAGERARKIKEGTYDFAEDEKEEEGLLDIPEALCESEEDKALDEKEAKNAKRLDKILNWIYFPIFVLVLIIIIINFFI